MERTYTNKDALVANIEEQKRLNNTSLRLLQSRRNTNGDNLQLEVYFYSDDSKKLLALSAYMENNGYVSDEIEESSSDGEYFLSAYAPPINTDVIKLNELTEHLCIVSYEYDCEFSGWEAIV